jgi:uncharacterized repeat protein (TIGR01451 family)
MSVLHRGRRAASQGIFVAAAAPLLALVLSLCAVSDLKAQNLTFGPPVPLAPGDLAVSGFSGTIPGETADKTVIDPEGFSIKIFDVSNFGGAPQSQILAAPVKGGVKAKDIGQVAPLAFDDAQGGNAGTFLYAGSTSAYGLHIVATDPGPDGKPVRLKKGAPGAKFMDGLFGKDGSPGAIWKIDLATGKAGLLADTAFSGVMNSGPGLGDIAYDPKSRSVYASDLDTGLIHRFATDYNAANLGQYDHGVAGRTAVGIPPVPDDGKTADILSPAFDTAKPETWGFTQAPRRVHALAVNSGRLYYSVAEEPSVWSVGLNPDGSFAGDTRHELSMPAARTEPITDIVFDAAGAMIVSKRGPQKDGYSFTDFIENGGSQALRLPLPDTDDGLRGPVDYGVGFSGESKSASGGISLQYGYTPSGHIDTRSCGQTLAVTGDGLREYPADPANPNAIFLLDGVQMSDVNLAGSQNIPPLRSGFLPFDDRQKGTNLRGHVGDVEAFMPCQVIVASAPEMMPDGDWGGWGGAGPIISNPPIVGGNDFGDLGPNIIEPPIVDGPMGGGGGLGPDQQGGGGGKTPPGPLIVTKKATVEKCSEKPNDPCKFAITISNDSPQPLTGPITVTDTISAGALDMSKAQLIAVQPPAPWTCVPKSPKLECTHPGPIPAGQGATINVIVHPQGTLQAEKAMKNCASAKTATGIASQEACASIPTEPQPKLTIDKKFESATCTTGPNAGCGFTIKITNNGFANFKGPLDVNEVWKNDAGQPFTGGKAEVLSPTTAGFTCGDPASGIFKCTKPDVDLKPGESLTLRLGASFPKGTQKKFENCAQITNHSAQCVSVPLVNGPSLQISKKMSSSIFDPVCTPFCEFEILVKNVGNEPFEGPIVVKDFPAGLEAGAVKLNPVKAPWECAGNGNEKQCTHPKITLHPGNNVPALTFKAAYQTQSKDWQNCATLVGVPADPGNATSCINLTSESKANIKITKKASTETCEIGGPCKFIIVVSNTGPHGFNGPIKITDEITGGIPTSVTKTAGDDGYKCTPGAAGKITCEAAKMVFSPQGGNSFEITVVPGPSWKKNDVLTNCATLQYGPDGKNGNDHGTIKTDDKGCASIKLDPFKLEAQKSGDQQCQPGGDCKFKLTIFNPGPIDHHAPVIVTDSISGVGNAQIVSINPPLGCPQQPTSVPFTCTIPHMDLVVDQRVDHEVVLKLPDAAQGGSFSNCLDIKGQASGGTGASKACVAVALAPKEEPKQEQQQQQNTPPPPPATNALPALRCAADEVGVYPNCYKPNNPGSGGSNMVAPQAETPVSPPPVASAPPPQAKKVVPCKGGKVGTPPNCRCPANTVERKGVCQARSCPQGTRGKYPNCVRDCPPGTIYEDGVCLRDPGNGGYNPNRPYQECPYGTSGEYPNCVRDCPTGYIFRNGVCMPRYQGRPDQDGGGEMGPRECPPGTIGRYPRCRAPGGDGMGGSNGNMGGGGPPQCPPGTIGAYPRCGRPTIPTGPQPQMPQQVPDQVGPSPKPTQPPPPKACPSGLKGPNCDVLDVR